MGEVYLAKDTQLDRKIAIKLVPPESVADEQSKKRLIRLARPIWQVGSDWDFSVPT
jgi:serine/threonine protein kinase